MRHGHLQTVKDYFAAYFLFLFFFLSWCHRKANENVFVHAEDLTRTLCKCHLPLTVFNAAICVTANNPLAACD